MRETLTKSWPLFIYNKEFTGHDGYTSPWVVTVTVTAKKYFHRHRQKKDIVLKLTEFYEKHVCEFPEAITAMVKLSELENADEPELDSDDKLGSQNFANRQIFQ